MWYNEHNPINMFIYIAITCLLGLTASSPVHPVAEIPVPSYGFNYAVRDPLTGDNKAQTETRNGGIVKGSYSLTEPDGTLRVVDYVADPIHGFNAVVRRSGPSALHTIGLTRPIAGPIVAPIAAAPFAHSRQIGGHSATIWPAAQVSLDSIPDVAGRVGLGGYGFGLGGYSAGLGGYGAGLGMIKG